jgi:uncharacterized protein with HEPN domain
MNRGPGGDALYLDQILELIDLIRENLDGIDQGHFLEDRTRGDATALRLGAIGEASRKLSDELRARHTQIDWRRMYSLRNIAAHHYQKLNYRLLWKVASEALEPLEAVCRAELKRIDG